MKIESGRAVEPTTGKRRAADPAAAGFAPQAEPAAARVAPAMSVAPAVGVDGVLALQADGFEPGRRARQVRRGEQALDRLAELAAGLLAGRADAQLRNDLASLQAQSAPTGEPGLDAVLQEIDIRVAVELAKLEHRG
jgi:hypothetical protein